MTECLELRQIIQILLITSEKVFDGTFLMNFTHYIVSHYFMMLEVFIEEDDSRSLNVVVISQVKKSFQLFDLIIQ